MFPLVDTTSIEELNLVCSDFYLDLEPSFILASESTAMLDLFVREGSLVSSLRGCSLPLMVSFLLPVVADSSIFYCTRIDLLFPAGLT